MEKILREISSNPKQETIDMREAIVEARFALRDALKEAGYKEDTIEMRLHAFTFYLLKGLGYISIQD